MNFRETIEKAREFGISPIDLEVANECQGMVETLCKVDFEVVCEMVKDAYLASENLAISQLAWAIPSLISKGRNIDDITKRDIIDEACYM